MGIFVKGTKRSSAHGHMLDLDIPKDEKEFPIDKGESLPSPWMHALVSPAAEEVPIWNILPSYQLYESTFSKVMDPSIGDFDDEPPTYEDSPPLVGSSPTTENDYFTSQRGRFGMGPGHSVRTPEPRWENSILAHVHQMKHVDEFNKSIGSKLKIDIVLTRNPGALGKKPVTYNAQESEFSQSDSIHGYVVVTNKCDEPLNFDMFSVVFEGRMAVNSSETGTGTKPFLFYKFLNMFDYNASWTPAYFEETSSEPISFTDPVDGTFLQFPFKRKLMPGVSYKKFFNFTIPLKLLDCACEAHEIPEHCVLFPSIGLDKSSFMQRLRKLRESKVKPERVSPSFTPVMRPSKPLSIRPSKPVSVNPPVKKKSPNLITRDFGFPDTSISYSVETKLISKRSNYDKSCSTKHDEFVIVKDAGVPVRIIPRDVNLPGTSAELFTAEKHYEAFLKSVQKCIDIGNRLENGEDLHKVTRKLSITKQIYNAKASRSNTASSNDATYTVHFPYKKKQLAQAGRIVGLLDAHVRKKEHSVRYVTPYIFAPTQSFNTKAAHLKVRIDLEYFNTDNECKGVKPPDIRGVTAKIVICTLRSKKYPIPIEFTQEMKFRNVLGTNDTIEKYIIAPFKTHLQEMTKLISAFGMHPLGINKQMLMDVKSLANLEFKTTSMKIDNVCVNSKGGLGVWNETPTTRKANKFIDIDIDVQSLFTKDSKRPMEDKLKGALTLVPTFQSCIMCRYYYLLVEIKLGNGDSLPVKIPFKIAK